MTIAVLDGNGALQTVNTLGELMAIIATASGQNLTNTKLDTLHADFATLDGFVDGLEALVGATNAGNTAILNKLPTAPALDASSQAILAKMPAKNSSTPSELMSMVLRKSDGTEIQFTAIGAQPMNASQSVTFATDQTPLSVVQKALATTNGMTSARVLAAASTNATSTKASAGNIFEIDLFNYAAYDVFVKLYNKASAPTVGTDTPIMTIPLISKTGFARSWPKGKFFSAGIAYAITKAIGDSDTTAVAAGDVTGNLDLV